MSLTPPTKAQQDLFAADVLRYFLLREIPFGQDGSFSFDALITRYNADLANGYGNLVSRTLNMIDKLGVQRVIFPAPLGVEAMIERRSIVWSRSAMIYLASNRAVTSTLRIVET